MLLRALVHIGPVDLRGPISPRFTPSSLPMIGEGFPSRRLRPAGPRQPGPGGAPHQPNDLDRGGAAWSPSVRGGKPWDLAGIPDRPGPGPEALAAGGRTHPPIVWHGRVRPGGSRLRVRYVVLEARSVRGHEQAVEVPSRVALMDAATRHAKSQLEGLPTLRQAHRRRPDRGIRRPLRRRVMTSWALRLSDRGIRLGAPAGGLRRRGAQRANRWSGDDP